MAPDSGAESLIIYQRDRTKSSEKTQIDPRGDLKLVVGFEEVCFIICSRSLARSSPVWDSMLYGGGTEAKPEDGQEWVVSLPNDDPSAMEFMLLLVHGQPHKLPEVTIELAFEVAVLTKQYDMTHCLWPCAKAWLEDLSETWVYFALDLEDIDHIRWVYITQQLGGLEQYKDVFSDQVLSSDASKWKTMDENIDDFANISESGKVAISAIFDEIQRARSEVLNMMIQPLQKRLAKIESVVAHHYTRDVLDFVDQKQQPMCKASEESSREAYLCDLVMYGSTKVVPQPSCVSQPLAYSLEIWNSGNRNFAPSIPEEIYTYMTEVEGKAEWLREPDHSNCKVFDTKLPTEDELHDFVKQVPREKEEYIKRQAQLSGLCHEMGSNRDQEEDM